jgi:hypothetical protein
MAEKNSLLGSSYPEGMSTGGLTGIEKLITGAVGLLSVVSAILCVVYGIKYHVEHVVMAGVIVVLLVNFLFIARMYMKDLFETRGILYFATASLLAVSVVGLVYAVKWQALPAPPVTTTTTTTPAPSCQGFYQASSQLCLYIDDLSIIYNNLCVLLTPGGNGYQISPILSNVTIPLTCPIGDQVLDACYPNPAQPYSCA